MTVYINGTTGYTGPISSVGSISSSGNLTFTGVGAVIAGDFTNATLLSRTVFQTTTANSSTGIYALPSGTSTAASWQATNAADPTNASKILIATNGSTDVQLVSGRNGTGTYLPLTFYTNGAEKMRLDTGGSLGVGVTPSAWGSSNKALEFSGGGIGAPTAAGYAAEVFANCYYDGTNWIYKNNGYANRFVNYGTPANSTGAFGWFTAGTGTAGGTVSFTQAMTLNASGNLLVGTTSADITGVTTSISSNAAVGYGARNANTGTAAYSGYQLGNSIAANRAGLALFGSSWTSSGLYLQDGVYLYCSGAGGITLAVESAQPLVLATSNTERMRVNAGSPVLCLSGGNTTAGGTGIAFPASQNSSSDANTLDDYEEGFWTPSFYGTGTAGTFSPSSSNGGRYVKVGMQVTCWANVNGSLSGASGDMNVSGLPFTNAGNGGTAHNAVYSTGAIQYWAGISVSPMGPLILPGTTNLYFHTYTGASAGASGAQPVVVNGVNMNCHFFVTYFTVA